MGQMATSCLLMTFAVNQMKTQQAKEKKQSISYQKLRENRSQIQRCMSAPRRDGLAIFHVCLPKCAQVSKNFAKGASKFVRKFGENGALLSQNFAKSASNFIPKFGKQCVILSQNLARSACNSGMP
jgi:hypothetical protein